MDYGAIISMVMAASKDAEAGKITQQQFDLLKEQLARVAAVPLPELERVVAQQQGRSELGGIQRDDGLRNKQMQALGAYQDIIDGGGMTLDDRVAEEAALSQADASDKRRRAGIMADLQSRGQMNSGAALIGQLSSAQDAANRGRQSGQESAARAQKRKMEALEALAGGAGRLRQQDYGEASDKARAQDDINRWNAGAREKAGYYNAGLGQQNFANQMTKATGTGGAANNLAGAYGNEAAGVRSRGDAQAKAAGMAVNQGIDWASNQGKNSGTYDWGRQADDEYGERGGYTDLSEYDEDFK